jgi:putative transposase
LLKKWKEGELDEKPKPPSYWKDRKTGKRKSVIVMRNDCYNKGVSEIIVGDIKNIRDGNNNNNGSKVNSMIHNFWSLRYITERLRTTAENYGMKIKFVEESYISSVCTRCGSTNVFKNKRLLKCLDCGIEMHRGVAGVLNITRVY